MYILRNQIVILGCLVQIMNKMKVFYVRYSMRNPTSREEEMCVGSHSDPVSGYKYVLWSKSVLSN